MFPTFDNYPFYSQKQGPHTQALLPSMESTFCKYIYPCLHLIITNDICLETSMILEQELRRWVGKIEVCIGLYFPRVGNTSFHSTVQLHVTSLASVEGTLTLKIWDR